MRRDRDPAVTPGREKMRVPAWGGCLGPLVVQKEFD